MPSSLIFAALAAAWLVILVPIFARRRQEVSHTTDTALAARVVRRGSGRPPVAGAAETDRVEEAFTVPDHDRDGVGGNDVVDVEPDFDGEPEDDQWRRVYSDDVRAGRRYRPGRGGYDPEAAALAARAKYARRQRTVLIMLLAAVTTAALGGLVTAIAWWLHVLVDLGLAGYLFYLRRQVRIEGEVRERRLARLSDGRSGDPEAADDESWDDEDEVEEEEDVPEPRTLQRAPQIPVTANAVAVDIDDEDPMFDELDERTWTPYRRAAGE